MGLRLKFNLVLLGVFAIGLAVSGYISYELLRRNAQDEVVRSAGLMMETALAIRGYTIKQVRPIFGIGAEGSCPQTVPAYAATETLNTLRTKYPDFTYREATLNPTNPRNTAVEWENELDPAFRQSTSASELSGQRRRRRGPRSTWPGRSRSGSRLPRLPEHAGGRPGADGQDLRPLQRLRLAHGRDRRRADRLRTDGAADRERQPRPFDLHGLARRRLRGALPHPQPDAEPADRAPDPRMARAADQISTGDFKVAEFGERGRDEMARLGRSFNRMRRSLEKTMQRIERR